jgi:hypothetical protein
MEANELNPKIEEKKKMVAKWKTEYDALLIMAASTQSADHT